MMRRISANGLAASGLALPPNVIRLPRGPEKNARGFQKWCRNRMSTSDAPAPAAAAAAAAPQATPSVGPLRKPGSRAVPIVAPPPETDKKQVKEEATEDKKVVDEATATSKKAEEPAAAPEQPEQPAAVAAPAAAPEAAGNDESGGESGDSGNEDEGHFS